MENVTVINLVKQRETRKRGGTEFTLTFFVDNEDTNNFRDWINQKLKEGKLSIEYVPRDVEEALEAMIEAVVDDAVKVPGTIDDVALERVIERAVRNQLAVFGVRGCYA